MIYRQLDDYTLRRSTGCRTERIVTVKKAQEKIFKCCSMCAAVWHERTEFISDTHLQIEGYQADFEHLEQGLVYFTHTVDGCYSTMAVKASEFLDLIPGKPFTSRKTMTEDCPGYCLHQSNIQRCKAECECAYVRDLLHILQSYKKADSKHSVIQLSI